MGGLLDSKGYGIATPKVKLISKIIKINQNLALLFHFYFVEISLTMHRLYLYYLVTQFECARTESFLLFDLFKAFDEIERSQIVFFTPCVLELPSNLLSLPLITFIHVMKLKNQSEKIAHL